MSVIVTKASENQRLQTQFKKFWLFIKVKSSIIEMREVHFV